MQISPDGNPESNNELLKSGTSLRRIDPFRRKDFNLTSPGDENIENLSDGDKIDVNRIYTSWSRWSRCSRKCKQKRERRCAVPQVQTLTNYVISKWRCWKCLYLRFADLPWCAWSGAVTLTAAEAETSTLSGRGKSSAGRQRWDW